MTPDDFQTALRADGFADVDTRSLPPSQINAQHSHPFGVRALVLEGEITLTVAGERQVYRGGDVFTMAAGCEHAEQVGASGVSYLVGRKH